MGNGGVIVHLWRFHVLYKNHNGKHFTFIWNVANNNESQMMLSVNIANLSLFWLDICLKRLTLRHVLMAFV